MKNIESVRLDRHVLAVAKAGAVGDWAAYIGPAFMDDTVEEQEIQIAGRGSKLPKDVAELLFPAWKELTWRY